MKYKLLAIAAASLVATGAHAQSSVTLYGVADAGIEYISNAPGHGGGSVVRMSSGNMSTSRWGVRGTEDLGGGLKGVFTLESGFALDTGTGNSRLFDRQAYVGLQGGFGSVTLGRHQTPMYDFALQFDPMAISNRYSILAQDAGMSSRADNSVKYTGTFGGLTASALYSFGYDSTTVLDANGKPVIGAGNGEVPGKYRQGKEYSLAANYVAGPFAVGAAYEMQQLFAVANDKYQRATLAGTYAIGPAKVYAGYRWFHATGADFSAALPYRSNLYWIGAGYRVTPALSLTGSVYYQDFAKTNADPWSFVASADYALSKRTDMYLNLAYALNKTDNGKGIASAIGVNGLSGGSIDPIMTTASKQKANQFGAVVGIRHKF